MASCDGEGSTFLVEFHFYSPAQIRVVNLLSNFIRRLVICVSLLYLLRSWKSGKAAQLRFYRQKFDLCVNFHSFPPFSAFSLLRRVKNWALKFGVDLWEFGRQFTKLSEIKSVSISISE